MFESVAYNATLHSGSIAGFIRVKEIKTFSNDLSRDPDITCKSA